MGLFSNILGGGNSSARPFNPQEAFLGIVIGIVAADGHISDEEVNDFVSIANKSALLKSMSNQQFDGAVDLLLRILRRDGVDALLDQAVQGLPAQYRESAFAVACDLACSDGYIEPEEEQVLERLQSRFGIQDPTARKILEVISVKNRI